MSTDRRYEAGDVVWTADPFKTGDGLERLFLVVSRRTHPFDEEQFVGATVTTTDHGVAHPLRDEYWEYGGTPRQSYVLPLSLHTPRLSNVRAPAGYDAIEDPWQGRVTEAFLTNVIDEIVWTLRRPRRPVG
ncbi:hypothetical protein RYH80_07640 [Halobaculum sp. MBLA0147]|uniref:hypothetical protein n=1 Tax=Halobaculum sp. MBLA0147 TaxID=3079934 RepID=UPI003525D750